jgi:hypothetical protein
MSPVPLVTSNKQNVIARASTTSRPRAQLSPSGGRATETSSDTGVDAAAGCADKRKAHELSRPVLSDLLQEGARQLQGLGIVDPRRFERLL